MTREASQGDATTPGWRRTSGGSRRRGARAAGRSSACSTIPAGQGRRLTTAHSSAPTWRPSCCGAASAPSSTGLSTDRCVSTTARLAANFGFATYVVADATATFDRLGPPPDGRRHAAEDVHAVALAELNGEFALIVDTASVLEAAGASPGAAA